ncbi:MAG: hypothetical protein Kow0020_00200 [Wenzhouxiangellaceae bacterium]
MFKGTTLRTAPLALLLALTATCIPGIALSMSFQDVSASTGFMPAMNADIPAGGIAVADFDRDGWPDIFVTGFFLPNRLFFNDGSGAFFEIPAVNQQLAGVDCGVTAAADFDNDGWTDLYVACRGDGNHLFRNLTGTGFADVTPPELQHQGSGPQPVRTDAVAWGDLDGNGLADLFIGVYPTNTTPDPSDPSNLDRIVLNLGDGQWQTISSSLPSDQRLRTALAATFSDLDLDGDQDLYVINDKEQGNVLWRNDGPGCGGWCLTDIAVASGADRPVYGMGIAVGDVDRDGLPDLFFSSIGEQVMLRATSTAPLTYSQIQQSAGVNYPGVGWATIFCDFDHDGWEDAYLAISGHPDQSGEFRDRLYRNLGTTSFLDQSNGSGLDMQLPSMAAATIDYDRDGDLDLVIGHATQGYRLYRNDGSAGQWIAFELIGGAGITRDALGAKIEVVTPQGSQWRELRAGESRGSSHQPLLHFGLGPATSADVTVHWPNGMSVPLGNLPAGAVHRVEYDPGVLMADGFES